MKLSFLFGDHLSPDLNRNGMGVIEGHQGKAVKIQGLNYGLKHKKQSISELCQQKA